MPHAHRDPLDGIVVHGHLQVPEHRFARLLKVALHAAASDDLQEVGVQRAGAQAPGLVGRAEAPVPLRAGVVRARELVRSQAAYEPTGLAGAHQLHLVAACGAARAPLRVDRNGGVPLHLPRRQDERGSRPLHGALGGAPHRPRIALQQCPPLGADARRQIGDHRRQHLCRDRQQGVVPPLPPKGERGLHLGQQFRHLGAVLGLDVPLRAGLRRLDLTGLLCYARRTLPPAGRRIPCPGPVQAGEGFFPTHGRSWFLTMS